MTTTEHARVHVGWFPRVRFSVANASWLVLLFFVPALAAFAREPGPQNAIEAELQRCQDKNASTAGTIECIQAAAARWDKQLNAAYSRLRSRLGAAGKQSLQASQLRWIDYRDTEYRLVDALYSSLQGTMYLPMGEYRKMKIVKTRALELDSYLRLVTEHRK